MKKCIRLTIVVLALAGVCAAWWVGRANHAELRLPDLSDANPRVAEAVQAASKRVADNPRSAAERGELGMLLMAHHYRPEALSCLRQASDLAPDEFRWRYYVGYLLEETDLESAAAVLAEAAAIQPRYLPLRIRLARVLRRLNREDEAERQLYTAADINSGDPYVLVELARIAESRGRIDEARASLERATATPGWYPRVAFVELARLCHKAGDRDAAMAAMNQAARLPQTDGTEFPDPLLRQAEAKEVLLRGFSQQADLLAAKGDWRGASESYRLIARQRPDMARPLLNLAQMLLMQGDVGAAMAAYQDACHRFPDDPQVWFSLAMSYEQLQRSDDAVTAYRRCLSIKSDNAIAQFSLGLILEKRGDLEDACAAYQSAVDADPKHAPAHLALGVLMQKCGRPKHLYFPHLEAAVQLVPGDPVPQSFLDQARSAAEP